MKRRTILSLALLPAMTFAGAQAPDNDTKGLEPMRVLHLSYIRNQQEADQILTALRNILAPTDKMYLVYSTSDIVLRAPEQEQQLAKELVSELDRPKPVYRLTYTLTESEAGKRIGVQHFSTIAVPGQHVVVKQGDKVPLVTGTMNEKTPSASNQITYLDVGINLDFTLDQFANTLLLHARVEQSAVAPAPTNPALSDDPIVRQTLLEDTSTLKLNKPTLLGGIDLVGSTRHVDVEVVAEPVQ